MEMFLYKLILTFIHSLWQSAILLVFHLIFVAGKHSTVKSQRHQTLLMVGTQLLLSSITFFAIEEPSVLQVFNQNEIGEWIAGHQIYFVIFYLSVLALRLIQTFSSWLSYRSLISSPKTKANPEIRNFTNFWAGQMGYGRKVTVWISSNITTPLTYGFFKPVILLPAALACTLTPQELEMLIIHELKHITNKDFLVNLFLIFTEIIFCCNPFLLRMVKFCRWNFERECDEQVIDLNYNPLQYAELLLLTAKTNQTQNHFCVPFNGLNFNLLDRIKLFSVTNHNSGKSNKKNYLILGILIVILIHCSIILPESLINTVKSTPDSKAIAQMQFASPSVVKTEPIISAQKLQNQNLPAVKNEIKKIESPTELQHMQADLLLTDSNIFCDSSNYSLPIQLVSMAQNKPEASKQMVVKDEDPTSGKSVTKIYELNKIGGQWIAKLTGIILENQSEEEHSELQ